jgi:hypothetical protein
VGLAGVGDAGGKSAVYAPCRLCLATVKDERTERKKANKALFAVIVRWQRSSTHHPCAWVWLPHIDIDLFRVVVMIVT